MNQKTPLSAFAVLSHLLAQALAAQEGVPAPQGLVPEQMWPAPTAADWQKPVQIQWQRTWDDAVLLSKQTQKPILVCVNMDGEIASEHYAGIRYRDAEIAKLYEPYICVMASVYRHNPADYDEAGRRIECPRFQGCTCGEHIAMEPIVYEKFLDGKRIAPRHIMVELDGSEVYDVFYTWDTESVFTTIGDGIKNRKIQAPPIVKGDRSIVEKIKSVDSQDRSEVEKTYLAADAEQKKAMLRAALELGGQTPIELLRLAAMGLDPALAATARKGLQQAKDPGAVDLIADTLRAQLPPDERKALVEALGSFAATSTKARTFANAHRGFAGERATIDTSKWQSALAGASYASAVENGDLAQKASRSDEALERQPASPEARLDVAEANLLQALAAAARSGAPAKRQAQRLQQMLFEDAQRCAHSAVALGASGWRVEAILAVCAKQRGSVQEAYDLAISAAPGLPPDAPGQLAMEVLALFAEGRQEAIVAAVRSKKDFPPQWTTDVHAAYAVLARHPFGRDVHAANHYDFLQFFGTPEAPAVLDRALVRFPDSALLHERLRTQILAQQPPAAVEAEYTRRLQATDAPVNLPWFAGYASLCVAEAHRRKSQADAALAAYARGIEHFDRYRAATQATDGEHYVAMAHAGIARILLQKNDLAGALAALQRVFATAPLAAASTDGLSITAMQTADMLRVQARKANDTALIAKLDAALATLPPAAFALPEYERGRTGGQPRRRD